jgi:leucyl aminopeptidase (aminopeptidase T)
MRLKATLHMLRVSREAARDAVVDRLNVAKSQHAAALARYRSIGDSVLDAQRKLHEVSHGLASAENVGWRLIMRDSCQTLFDHHLEQLVAAAAVRDEMASKVAEHRQELNECERKLMRNDEWAEHMKQQDRIAQRLDEQSQDDDLAASHRSRGLTAITSAS